MTFCAVSRDLARYQAEVDDQAEHDQALEDLIQEELLDELDNSELAPAMAGLAGGILAGNAEVKAYFENRLSEKAEQSANDAAESAAESARDAFDAGWYC